MKCFLLIVAINLLPNFVNAQDSNTKFNGIGITLNSSLNSELNSILIAPGAYFYCGKNQFELDVGFNPFNQKDQGIVSGAFNYRYFPNGTGNAFNMYLMMSCSYVNQLRKTYYPSRYQYLFLNGGYGFQIKAVKGMYIGTNINIGTFTNSKGSENPYNEYYGSEKLFDKFDMSLSCQIVVGCHFERK